MLTVVIMIPPYLLIRKPFVSLGVCLGASMLVILVFSFYISVANDTPFRRQFWDMVPISLGAAGVSFLIGIFVKHVFGVEV